MAEQRLDTRAIRRAFNQASTSFDGVAALHSEARQRALSRLQFLRQTPAVVLDLGSGTGAAAQWLLERYPAAKIIAIDSAERMLQQPRYRKSWWRRRHPRPVCADATALPLVDSSVDWVFSNLVLPWCNDVPGVLSEIRRVLKPGGMVSLTDVGPDSFKELRRAWSVAQPGASRVREFADMHDLGDALIRAGFAEPVVDMEPFVVTYRELATLNNEFRSLGVRNALHARPRGLLGRQTRGRFDADYERQRVDGALPVTIELVYAQAWRSDKSPASTSSETRIPLASIGRRQPNTKQ